jgi:hypothetical protein
MPFGFSRSCFVKYVLKNDTKGFQLIKESISVNLYPTE